MNTKKIRTEVWTHSLGLIWVDAYLTPTKGLVVHETIMPDGADKDWALTHHSGFRVRSFDTRQDAITFATLLGKVCSWHNWTCTREHGAPDYAREAKKIADERFARIKEVACRTKSTATSKTTRRKRK